MKSSVVNSIATRVMPITESGCIIWMGCLNAYGYGVIKHGGNMVGAHRISYEIANGKIPDGYHILHRCDVPCCINPDHLFIGTAKDNMQDKKKKQRQQRGERVMQAKLTAEKVKQIRQIYETKKLQQWRLAEMFGVGQSVISRIINNKAWSHV